MILLLQLLLALQHGPGPIFKEQVIDDKVSIGYGVAIGDVDGDKKPDILLADKKQVVWYRNGDWKKHIIAENLTESDNVCIAARDINGDGKVEVAVGAQWNPGETSDTALSGAVFYLERPKGDLNKKWKPIKLHHEPTVHRMRWVKSSSGKYFLVVLPLHGRGNKNGEGEGVRIIAYEFPKNADANWPLHTLSQEMHLTHNMAIKETKDESEILVAGKEGIRQITERFDQNGASKTLPGKNYPAGEIKLGKKLVVTIEPMHGNKVVVYEGKERTVLDSLLHEGHGVGVANFHKSGNEQVVAGWRNPDKDGLVGIKLYSKNNGKWQPQWIDKNGMACEDLQIADLNGDGKEDIIASGRSTKNLKVYWNTSK